MVWIGLGFAVFLMIFSGLFSGAEIGVYRLSRFRLRLGVEQKRKAYTILSKAVNDGPMLILSLLLGNNCVNYLITSIVTILLYRKLENQHKAEIYAAILLAPLLFIFCEMIPKNIFYYKADTLLPRLSWGIWYIHRLFCRSGLLWVFKHLSLFFSKILNLSTNTTEAVDKTQRYQVRQIIHETQEEGLLSQTQREMINRLIDIPGVSAASMMVPIEKAGKIPLMITRQDLLRHLSQSRFTRQLVYDRNPSDIVGYLSIYDVLSSKEDFETVRPYVMPLAEVSRTASIIEAINILRNRRDRIALVVDYSKGIRRAVGLITISDLIEELTGELAV
ncbi:MAG TPA: CNNM domain-containing protein [Anaerohalosphaeraceae bacterium]|nr:CNNM domain-containing protein [Anaerohalosphaeraceae bacterium]